MSETINKRSKGDCGISIIDAFMRNYGNDLLLQ